jgi:hypothetical protein
VAAKDAADAEIEALLREASRIDAPGIGWATWRQSKDRTVIDWRAVAAALRAIAAMRDTPAADLDAIEAAHTETRPGSRPLLVKPEKEG